MTVIGRRVFSMLALLLVLWTAILTALVAFGIGRSREGGALTLAYFLGLSLIHVPGALAFSTWIPFASSYGLSNREATQAGLTRGAHPTSGDGAAW